jgi:nicotinate dehydrogenase subunit A
MTTEDIPLKVNGKVHTVHAEPDTPLLYILRNDLEQNGPKYGCGLGQCGACTVIMNGQSARSCVVTVAMAKGADITTLDGLGTREKPHPVQVAFIEEQAAQCGYCLNGMVMEATAFLSRNPSPSEADIRSALARNLCRCGAHVEIVKAVKRAATLRGRG